MDATTTIWVWMLTCRHCPRTVDLDAATIPTQPIAEWAVCCGQMMELDSVERNPTDA